MMIQGGRRLRESCEQAAQLAGFRFGAAGLPTQHLHRTGCNNRQARFARRGTWKIQLGPDQPTLNVLIFRKREVRLIYGRSRSEERRVGKECRSGWLW